MSDVNYVSSSFDCKLSEMREVNYIGNSFENTTNTPDDVEKIYISPDVIDEFCGEIINYVQSSDDVIAQCHYLKYTFNSIDMTVVVQLMIAEYRVHKLTVQWNHVITLRQLKHYGFPLEVIRTISYLYRGPTITG